MDAAASRYVWVPDEKLIHAPAEVINDISDGGTRLQIRVLSTGEIRDICASQATTLHPSCLEGVADLLELGELDMPALLHNIRLRYGRDKIYTSVGFPILISVNPYRPVKAFYTPEVAAQYRQANDFSLLSPHPFAIAQRALNAICQGEETPTAHQSIIISGESGAGKTEATKIILRYLAASECGKTSFPALESQLTQSNPLLEAFGNAKTVRNDNSSRFGKFSEVLILRSNKRIVGAKISSYLLEKSRIVRQQPFERNYHIFYQLCAGIHKLSNDLRAELQLKPAIDFRLLATCGDVAGRDDALDYEEILGCLNSLEFDDETRNNMWRILAGILHLGEVNFSYDEEQRSSNTISVENTEELATSSRLLGLPKARLEEVLCFNSIPDAQSRQAIRSPKSVAEAEVCRESLCKSIYERLFQWLIDRVNAAVAGVMGTAVGQGTVGSIGLLDIFGFEVFEENSFEQLCINFANEQLQQRFNQHVFAEEQALYQSEGIHWAHIEFADNSPVLETLIGRPHGILLQLDSECVMPKGCDASFLLKLKKAAEKDFNVLRSRSPKSPEEFGVRHYAGSVFYNVQGMLDKNREQLQQGVVTVLCSSTNPVLSNATLGAGDSVPGFAKSSVSCVFRKQLSKLMEVLRTTNASYLRCIKPNDQKMPRSFASADIIRQLRCAGMLESIRIRKAGYALRVDIAQFVRMLAPLRARGSGKVTDREVADGICKRLELEFASANNLKEPPPLLYQIGRTKVFLKNDVQRIAEQLITRVKVEALTQITAVVRGAMARKHVKELRQASKFLISAGLASVWQHRFLKYRKNRQAVAARRVLLALKMQVAWRRVYCGREPSSGNLTPQRVPIVNYSSPLPSTGFISAYSTKFASPPRDRITNSEGSPTMRNYAAVVFAEMKVKIAQKEIAELTDENLQMKKKFEILSKELERAKAEIYCSKNEERMKENIERDKELKKIHDEIQIARRKNHELKEENQELKIELKKKNEQLIHIEQEKERRAQWKQFKPNIAYTHEQKEVPVQSFNEGPLHASRIPRIQSSARIFSGFEHPCPRERFADKPDHPAYSHAVRGKVHPP